MKFWYLSMKLTVMGMCLFMPFLVVMIITTFIAKVIMILLRNVLVPEASKRIKQVKNIKSASERLSRACES